MEEIESRFLEVMVRPEQVDAARALKPIDERQVMGGSILMFDGVDRSNWPAWATCAPPASPTCSLP